MIRFALLLLFILLPYGMATIDGNNTEWSDLNFLARMYVPDPDHTEVASLYGTTDCTVMWFAAIADEPGSVLVDSEESWVKINGVAYEDVTYINQVGEWADGWEIQVPITAVEFSLEAHVTIYDGAELQTVHVGDLAVVLDCTTDADTLWFQCGGELRTIACAWQTGSEISITMFYVYRDGELLAQVAPRTPGQPLGWTYVIDDHPGGGDFTYSLTTIYNDGHMELMADRVHVRWRVFVPAAGKAPRR